MRRFAILVMLVGALQLPERAAATLRFTGEIIEISATRIVLRNGRNAVAIPADSAGNLGTLRIGDSITVEYEGSPTRVFRARPSEAPGAVAPTPRPQSDDRGFFPA